MGWNTSEGAARWRRRRYGWARGAAVPWFFAAWFVSVVQLRAHPVHTSYAEADYRAETGRLEVAIRVFADDMETALTQRTGRKVALAGMPKAERETLLLTYVRERWVVRTREGKALTLTWVGSEMKGAEAQLWIYVECPLTGGVAGARFAHRLLREIFSDQINSVVVRDHGVAPVRTVTLLFTDEREQAMPAGK